MVCRRLWSGVQSTAREAKEKMNAAGQVLVEYLLLAAVFIILVAGVAKQIPLTFNNSTPVLGAKIEQRLETGSGFNRGDWKKPNNPVGGIK